MGHDTFTVSHETPYVPAHGTAQVRSNRGPFTTMSPLNLPL